MSTYEPKKQFIVGTMFPKGNNSVNMGIISALRDRFSSNDRNVLVVDFDAINEETKQKFIGQNMLDLVIFTPETFEKCKEIIEQAQRSNNNQKISTAFMHAFYKKSPIVGEINRQLLGLGLEVRSGIVTTPADCEVLAINTEGGINERKQVLKKEREIFIFAENIVRRMEKHKDSYTAQHLRCVCDIVDLVAIRRGFGDFERDVLRIGALIHDIGKEDISDGVLKKPGKLTDEEFVEMKSHVICGQVELEQYNLGVYERAKNIAAQHHERFDGRGYPHRLKGDEIDPLARIVQVADAVHAMLGRSYQKAKTKEQIIEELKNNSNPENVGKYNEQGKEIGCQFDPDVADILIDMIENDEIDLEDYRVKEEEILR